MKLRTWLRRHKALAYWTWCLSWTVVVFVANASSKGDLGLFLPPVILGASLPLVVGGVWEYLSERAKQKEKL